MTPLAHACDIAESAVRRSPCVFGQDPRSDLLLAAQFKMKAHLLIQIALKPIAMEQHLQPSIEFSGKAHGFPHPARASTHAVWITREMAPITRSNCDISTPSCLLPSGVSV